MKIPLSVGSTASKSCVEDFPMRYEWLERWIRMLGCYTPSRQKLNCNTYMFKIIFSSSTCTFFIVTTKNASRCIVSTKSQRFKTISLARHICTRSNIKLHNRFSRMLSRCSTSPTSRQHYSELLHLLYHGSTRCITDTTLIDRKRDTEDSHPASSRISSQICTEFSTWSAWLALESAPMHGEQGREKLLEMTRRHLKQEFVPDSPTIRFPGRMELVLERPWNQVLCVGETRHVRCP